MGIPLCLKEWNRLSVSFTEMSTNNRGTNANSGSFFKAGPFIILIAGLFGLYYLYQYLFGASTGNSYSVLSGKRSAKIDGVIPVTVSSNSLPTLFDGGEFTVSLWVYVNNWSYRSGYNKSILTIGGNQFDSMRIYLNAYKPKMSIRFHTKDTGSVPISGSATGSQAMQATQATPSTESLDTNMRDSIFKVQQPESGLLTTTTPCDLPEIDLQRWVNLVVSVNGRTVDVYLDGKLSRSCVLPSYFKVDPSGYSALALGYGGFGGQIANVVMYDAALNPERVYKQYMAGPEPINSLSDWFASFFQPTINNTLTPS